MIDKVQPRQPAAICGLTMGTSITVKKADDETRDKYGGAVQIEVADGSKALAVVSLDDRDVEPLVFALRLAINQSKDDYRRYGE